MTTSFANHPLVLLILDGWGVKASPQHNAIASAHTPVMDALVSHYPNTLLQSSGAAVGLPDRQPGNSEVGHVNLGAGRVVPQPLARVNAAIESGEFAQHPVLVNAIAKVKQHNSALHIMGLLSEGGVHSHEQHIFALLQLAREHKLSKVYVHVFCDGRDTPAKVALPSIARLEAQLAGTSARIVTVVGRYYPLDRDNRWDRIEVAYELLVNASAEYHYQRAEDAVTAAYERGENDEFVAPSLIGEPAPMQDSDVAVFMHFRPDRARQLTDAMLSESFTGFERSRVVSFADFVSLAKYGEHLPTSVIFEPLSLPNGLGEWVAKHGLTQFRIAETEKYAHVTYFFNGGVEQSWDGETRVLIPSPAVATYDQQPQMNAPLVTHSLIEAIKSGEYPLIVCNYANADMVGHCGKFDAVVQAVEAVDRCVGEVVAALKEAGGSCLITADHGNAESMFDEKLGQANPAHSSEPVPLIYVGEQSLTLRPGALCDVAPTALDLLGLPKPDEMTGTSLITPVAVAL